MKLRSNGKRWQSGLSLTGFIFVLIILALIAVVGMKVVPTVIEYTAIKKAIVNAKASSQSAAEIRASFDRQSAAGYIETISGKDLEITREASGFEVTASYEKKITLFGPVSLVIDYVASTQNTPVRKQVDQ